MVVYIEALILDNFFITLLIALLSYKALSQRPSKLRLIFACTLGTAISIIFGLLSWHWGFLLLIRVATFVTLAYILFFKKSKMLTGSLTFLAVSFVFGGALFSIGLSIHGSVENALTKPITNIPIGLIILGGLVTYFALKKILSKFKRTIISQDYKAKCTFSALGHDISTTGFIDTGNMLWCSKSDLPIIVLNSKLSLEILGVSGLSAFMREKFSEISKSAYQLEQSGVGGKKSKLLIIPCKNFEFYLDNISHKIEGVVLGLVIRGSACFNGCDVLLHPALLKQISLKKKSGKSPMQGAKT